MPIQQAIGQYCIARRLLLRAWCLCCLLILAGCVPGLSSTTPPAVQGSEWRQTGVAQAPFRMPVLATPTPTVTATIVPTTASTSTPLPSIVSTPTDLSLLPTPTLPVLDQQQRAEVFDRVWQLVADHYLYVDFGGVDWAQIKEQYRPQALAAGTSDQFYAMLTAMVDELGDWHSRFEDPQTAFKQQALADNKETYVGVGIATMPVDEGLLVTTVFPNSPATEIGIRRRDMIVAIDGEPVNHADPGMSGIPGSEVRLTVLSTDGETRDLTVQRRTVLAQIVPEATLLPQTGIGYLLIPSFWPQDMPDKVISELRQLLDQNGGQLEGLIIDLRGNSGGWRTVLEGVLAHFVQGDVGTFYNQRTTYPLTIIPSALYDQLRAAPMVVLVDENTESYAEVFAAVLQSAQRSQVVGASTAGNTETIFAYDLDDGSRLWLAQEGFRLPDESEIEGIGVTPDQPLAVDWMRFSEAHDPYILQAKELIHQVAAGSH
jgi:carboxyl-terminal processing protease